MTSRERVLTALAHQQPDRTPCDFWAEDAAWNRLLADRGCSDREQLLRQLEIDLRHLKAQEPPERAVGGGVFQNFWGERYLYKQTPWGPMREDVKGALAGAQSFAELEAFAWPTPDNFNHAGLKEAARQHENCALVYGFADVWQRPALVRGWEEMFVDMMERTDWVHFLCRKFTDFYLEDYTRAAEVTGGRIDLYLLISDLGTQRGPLISLAMFREFVAPYLKEMIERIHALNGQVLFHCCGSIRVFIPDLIQLGVDVLDPIQLTGPDMAPERLKADFGDRLSFHGGVDIKAVAVRDTGTGPNEARRYCETLGRGGGYILGPSHLFQPEVPPENVRAVYRGRL